MPDHVRLRPLYMCRLLVLEHESNAISSQNQKKTNEVLETKILTDAQINGQKKVVIFLQPLFSHLFILHHKSRQF